MKWRATCACLGLVGVLYSCADGSQLAGTSHKDAPLSHKHQSVTNSEPAPADSSVFLLEITLQGGTALCSATLVTRDLLLTAAHCLSGQFGSVDCDSTTLAKPLPLSSFRVSNVPDLTGTPDPSWIFPVIERVHVVHEGALLCGNDIGLFQLREALDASIAVPADVPLDTSAFQQYRAIGYGASHPSGTGERVRRASGPLDVACSTPEDCEQIVIAGAAGSPNTEGVTTASSEWVGSGDACPGDSGGPALTLTDAPQVLGVLSRGTSDCRLNIYTSPQSEAFRAAVRFMISDHEFGKMYEFPSWALDPDIPIEPAPADGGAAGAPSEPNPDASGGAYLGLTKMDQAGCACSTAGKSRLGTTDSWYFFCVAAFLLVGARRRYESARAQA